MGTHVQAHSRTHMYLHTWLGPEALPEASQIPNNSNLACIYRALTMFQHWANFSVFIISLNPFHNPREWALVTLLFR